MKTKEDNLTTVLGLSQLFIHLLDDLPNDRQTFKHELKSVTTNFHRQLEKTMDAYYRKAYGSNE
jgi:hypothetical protein